MVLVANSGPHFDANAVFTWLGGEGQKHLCTAPKRPCSVGKAEKFTRLLKTSIYSIAVSTFDERSRLLGGIILLSIMRCVESAYDIYYCGSDLRPVPTIVQIILEKRLVQTPYVNNLCTHNREPGDFVPISASDSHTNDCILDNAKSTSNTQSDRHTINL